MGETGAFGLDELDYYDALSMISQFSDDQHQREAGAEIANLLIEIAGVGAAEGGGFSNTNELKPMNYDEAMKCNDIPFCKKGPDSSTA